MEVPILVRVAWREVEQQEREALKLLSLSKWKARQAAVSIAVLPRGLSSNFK